MKENLNLEVSGHIKLYEFRENCRVLILDQKNAIQVEAKNIIRKALTGLAKIDKITCLAAGDVVLGSTTVGATLTSPNQGEVTFTGNISAASFAGTIEKLKLDSIYESQSFSIVSGLSVVKDGLTDLQVEWTIRINLT